MARRNRDIAIAAGPGWTDIYTASVAGGGDGGLVKAVLISCDIASTSGVEYRIVSPDDDAAEQARLEPGETLALVNRTGIRHIQMRGNGGAAVGGIEVLEPLN